MEFIINEDDCQVIIFRNYLSDARSKKYFDLASELCVNRRNKTYSNGTVKPRPRLTYGCGDLHLVDTEYPKSGFFLKEFPKEIEDLRDELYLFIRQQLDYVIYTDSCMINGYINNKDYIYPHSDNEALGEHKPVLTFSVGETRKIQFKWIDNRSKKITIDLNNGDLLLMYGQTNTKLTHTILKEIKEVGVRYSYTFRIISKLTLDIIRDRFEK